MAKPQLTPNVFECEVCSEEYDSDDRRPVCLMCGHSFCYHCLTFLETAENGKECPRCRQPITQPVDDLPTNYALIPSEKKLVSVSPYSSADRCKNHGCDLDYFCTDCGNILCRKCAKQFHAEHKVEFMDDIADKDELVMNLTDELQSKMKRRVDRLKESLIMSEKIMNAIDALQISYGDVQQCKNMLFAQQRSVDQDLAAWNAASLQSVAEKRKLSKNLCQYWKDGDRLLPDYQSLQLQLGRLIDNAKAVENLTKQFSAMLKEDSSLRAMRSSTSQIAIMPSHSPKFPMSPSLPKSTMPMSSPRATTVPPYSPKSTMCLTSLKSTMPPLSPKSAIAPPFLRSTIPPLSPTSTVPPRLPKPTMHMPSLKSTMPSLSLKAAEPSMKTQMLSLQKTTVPLYSSNYPNQPSSAHAYAWSGHEARRKM